MFTEAKEDKKIFMAKWDVKDGFWQMDCRKGEQWNFVYVLLQSPGSPVILVVPSSLQTGWVELPPFFCAATETSRDIALQYSNTAVGSLKEHKFEAYLKGNVTFKEFQEKEAKGNLHYLLEVYVDDFMLLIIPATNEEMLHVASIHDVFLKDNNDNNNPISLKKMKKMGKPTINAKNTSRI